MPTVDTRQHSRRPRETDHGAGSPTENGGLDRLATRKRRSEVNGRGTAGRTDREQCVESQDLKRDRAARVGQLQNAWNRNFMRIGADHTRGAGGAMLRGLEFAEKVVVFEGRRDQENGVQREPGKAKKAGAPIRAPAEHQSLMIPHPAHRPMRTLKRPATPPRSDSPACCEMSALPEDPGDVAVLAHRPPRPIHRCSRNSAPPFTTHPTWRASTLSPGSANDEVSWYDHDPTPAATYGRTRELSRNR